MTERAQQRREQRQQPEQASPEVRARVRASFDRQGLMALLGARLTLIAPGRAHIVLPARPEVTQQHGYFHAGATSAIADTAGGYAALTLFPETSEVLTVEYKINLLAPAMGDHIEAVGTVVKSGRTLTVCQLEVFAVQSEERALVANGQQTLIRVNRPER
ncbi:PaaI family thioesterase [Streptomyces paludis]|uniref:PaaI family thioesterase n=1 Tax=Streptomyces paludis TaxID=2282738 RepID=A0A345HWF1_9ACTN|nr:PaaI family thioesterase [Streptomyces paludis]AXG81025.1 PaaI family thioesterase [Streptomyces paludis]